MNTNQYAGNAQPAWIERVRLLEKLKVAVDCKLSLVIAPPGYGKTTTVKQFIQGTNVAAVWCTLDKRDRDLPILFEHIHRMISNIIPEIQELKPPVGTSPSEIATLLADYLDEHLTKDCLLVIDDIHELLDAPDVKVWLNSFIGLLPPKCHLILIGHAFPSLNIIDLIAYQKIISIGQEHLSFDRAEVGQLADQIKSTLTPEQLDNIFSRMAGWPAGIALALQPVSIEIEKALFEGEKAPEAWFDILADRLFLAQSPILQEFLLGSSTLLRMTPVLCQDALHLSNSLQCLTDAFQRNLFVTEVQGGIAYHALFRDFLQRKLLKQNPVQFTQYHKDAAQWFKANNQLEEAFEHYIVAGLQQEAANIAEHTAHLYVAQGKSETLIRWRHILSSTEEVHAPRFFHFCAMIHRDRYQYELASTDINTAELGFKANQNSLGVIQVTLTRATIENQQGHFHRALKYAEPFSHDTSIPSNLRGYALAIVGTAYLHLNQLDQASEILETSLSLWRQAGDQFAIAQLLMTLEVAYLHLGRFDAAAKCVEEVLSIRRAQGESTSIIIALNNLGYHYHLLGEYQQALGTLQEGLKISARISENRAINWLLQTMADLQRDQGAFTEADHLYRRSLQQISDKEPFLRANVLVGFSILRRWENKLDEAQQLALEARDLCQNHGLNWEHLLAMLALSAVDVYKNEFETSRHDLDALIEEWKLHPSPQLIQVLGIYAYGALLAGNIATAHHSLKLGIEHSGHIANLQPLIAEIIHNPMLRAFIERNAERYRILISGIKSLEKVQANPINTQAPSLPTYSLRISLLGQEHIERDGKMVSLSDWKAASARELFYYLLFNHPASREEIGLIFWPDSSPEQIRQKFHSTLHRIRDAIGTNVILFNDDLYSINPNLDLWCDVVELQTVIKQAELNSSLLSHTESAWYRAVELYRGDFLPAFDADWVLNQRELLRQKHLDSLLGLGNCLRIRGQSKEAVSVLKRALKIDSYREDIHRALLNCYYALGEYALISQHIDELTSLLENELGTKPSSETLRLKQKLIG